MTEYQLKSKARDYFEKQGYKVWFPPEVRWKTEVDIFSIWDGVAWRRNKFIFFQLTTLKHKSERLKKITSYMLRNFLSMNPPKVKGMVMAWADKKREFVIVEV